MKKKHLSVFFWITSVILMVLVSVYQRLTSPTTPIRGKTELNGLPISYKLLRTWGGTDDAQIKLEVLDKEIQGSVVYKRYKSYDNWDTIPLVRVSDYLVAFLPNQPPAGKIEYLIFLKSEESSIGLQDKPIIIRFKGDVPAWALIPHVFLMFLAMLFSIRSGLEALFVRQNTYLLTLLTGVFLFIGGMLFGPIVQKFAFGAYWTGWPFGNDLTDNKTAFVMLIYIIAILKLHKNRMNRFWPILSAVFLFLVYLIPHSTLGSEIDHRQEEIQTHQSE
jgi:hypothetical protein